MKYTYSQINALFAHSKSDYQQGDHYYLAPSIVDSQVRDYLSLLHINKNEEELIFEWIHAMEVLDKYSKEVRETPQPGSVTLDIVKKMTEIKLNALEELIKGYDHLVK